MNSHPTKDTLMEAHLEGEKGPVALHLTECAECRDYMSDLETIEDRASHKFSPSAAVLENIRKKARVTRKSGFIFAFRWPQLAGMAAIALIIGLNYINKKTPSDSPALPVSEAPENRTAPERKGSPHPVIQVVPAGYATRALSPENPDPLFSMARELENQNRWQEAARLYEVLYEKNAGTREGESALYHMGVCLEKSGEKERAIEKYEILKKINPTFPGLE